MDAWGNPKPYGSKKIAQEQQSKINRNVAIIIKIVKSVSQVLSLATVCHDSTNGAVIFVFLPLVELAKKLCY